MTLSVSTQVNPIGTSLIIQDNATNVADNNITGAPATLYMIDIDNTVAAASYVKLYNAVAPTVGTTDPDWIIMIPGLTRRAVAIPEGVLFSVGLSMACVTAGGTSGVLPPFGGSVVVRMLTS